MMQVHHSYLKRVYARLSPSRRSSSDVVPAYELRLVIVSADAIQKQRMWHKLRLQPSRVQL